MSKNKRKLKAQRNEIIKQLQSKNEDKMVSALCSFYPNYPDNMVKVSLIGLINQKDFYSPYVDIWRVCVWGQDDTGYEIDLSDYLDAKEMYERLTGNITFDLLKSYGFFAA